MSVPRFFADSIAPGVVTLSEAESRHARGSRRLSAGDPVVLLDGRGNEGAGSILNPGGPRRNLEVQIERVTHQPRPSPRLTLAVAMPKGPRQDWLVEKCTELGVAAIQPILTQRSVSEASPHRLSKWERIAIEAAKQSGQAWLPELKPPLSLHPALERVGSQQLYVAAAGAARRPGPEPWPDVLATFIGPEGDWTDEELAALTQAGARPICLGPNILRVETAAVAIAALVHAHMAPR
jgi:16S rRNA (uracil1498-N3)-methyltransferase